jgi:hypothetical protein
MLVISEVLVYGYNLKLSFNEKFCGYFQGQCIIKTLSIQFISML